MDETEESRRGSSSSSGSESDENQEIEATNPISVATNAGARLSEPKCASISRKRLIHTNQGKYEGRGNKRKASYGASASASDRQREYPNQHFAVVSGRLRCNACSETLALKKSSLDKHIKSNKHTKGISRIMKDKKESQSIIQCLNKMDNRDHPSGSTLPQDMRLFRFEIVQNFLSGGIPLTKIDTVRPLFEKYGQRLTSVTHLAELIPAVLEKEKETIKNELKDINEVSVIFDGTARLGEALAIVVRYVQDNFQPTQRLIRLEVLSKALKADELAQRLMTCLAVDYKFGSNMLIGGMRDGAAVNGAALRQLKFFFPNLMDIVCFSHTIDNVGGHFEFRILDSFTQHWIGLFAHSYNARLLWRDKTGQSIRSHSATRWWSKWEILQQVLLCFGFVEPFLRENKEICKSSVAQLLKIFDNPQDAQDLRLELAAIIDAGVHFVSATYFLEGDGPLLFSCYERLSAVSRAVAVAHYPNTAAVAHKIADGDHARYQQLMAQAKACIQPGLNFFQQKFSVQFHNTVRAFKVARLCCPEQVQHLKPTADCLEEFRNFPFLDNDEIIASLGRELPEYLAATDGVSMSSEDEKLASWAAHSKTLPNWSALVKKLLLLQPSSASAERVFSLLNNGFNAQQDSSLTDYLESSVMLRYNNAKRN